jgi:hypothetical protein
MARIRTIKPEFFTSADILALTPLARLFYVSLWCEADREGLLPWNPDTLKFRYLPKDKVDVESLGNELQANGLIAILTGDDGREYAEIPSFKQHQVINNREADSILLSRVKDASPRVPVEGRKEGKGREGKSPATRAPRFDPVEELAARGVQPQTADDWLTLRKAKRAAVTATALSQIIAEADKAGMSLERALAYSCRQGWAGFMAKWVKDDPDAKDAAPAKRDWE